MPINPEALIERLAPATRVVLEGAVALSRRRGHAEFDVEHYLSALIDTGPGDWSAIAAHARIDESRLAVDLQRALDRLPSGWTKKIVPSQPLMRMLKEAWMIASLQHGASSIRTGVTLLALLTDHHLERVAAELSRELAKIDADMLRRDYAAIVAASPEQAAPAAKATLTAVSDSGESCLGRYSTDLTQLARQGKIDPVVGRDREIAEVIDILLRRRQNNPILTGEAGVGKTAIVEALATRIANGDVHPSLKDASVHALDLARLQAGASARGDFEARLKGLIDEVEASPTPMILFIDEAHTIIGSGGAAGTGDAANILKPALARGELRTIAATTWSEYRRYFEDDSALARRFQVVKVDEPGIDACISMVRGVARSLETHHDVTIRHDALEAAVRLSSRYLPDRKLPDKAIGVLDTACSRVALQHSGVPQEVIARRGRLEALRQRRLCVRRELALGGDVQSVLDTLDPEIADFERELEALERRADSELTLAREIRHIGAELRAETIDPVHADHLRHEFTGQLHALRHLQGQRPLVLPFVDATVVASVIAGWTGVPVGDLLREQASAVLDLERRLKARVLGQDAALETIARRIATSRAGLTSEQGPIGAFLLVGPTGIGKTETAVALADAFYEGRQSLITINMTEFQESHTVSLLKGSPPGYVGFKDGGVLTEAVRRRPYSVVLLDEVEKAHPAVLRLFLQVFSDGRIEDSEGRTIDFRNTVLLLTTNAGSEIVGTQSNDAALPALMADLRGRFGPELIGRLTVVPYRPLDDRTLAAIVDLKLNSALARAHEVHGVTVSCDDTVARDILRRCREVESGARSVDAILTNTLLPGIATRLLGAAVEGRSLTALHISSTADGFVFDVDDIVTVPRQRGSQRRRRQAATRQPLVAQPA